MFTLSIDLGTSKICALVYDVKNDTVKEVISVANTSEVITPYTGRHEQCPEKTYAIVEDLVKQVVILSGSDTCMIKNITLSGQMHGIVIVDSSGKPVTNFITWRDQRITEDNFYCFDKLKSLLPENYHLKTGCYINSGYGAATLYWLKEHNMLKDGYTALSLADYIVFRFTGKLATEPTHVASWGLLDCTTNSWQESIIHSLDLPKNIFPEIIPTATPVGKLTQNIADKLGLSDMVLVNAPVGDNQASFAGSVDTDKYNPDSLLLNFGTGGQISIFSNSFNFLEGMETRPFPHNSWLLIGASLCSGWSFAYLMKFFKESVKTITGVDILEKDIYSLLISEASKVKADSNNLIVDARFSGTRNSPWLKGKIDNIDTSNFTFANLSYSFLTAIVNELFLFIEPLDNRFNLKNLFVSGNAIRHNKLLQKLVSDKFSLPCIVSSNNEEAALGAARLASK